ncbi:TetR/AcrR family transcriptional regulator [Silvimonas iriomotensis]|uniref:TetR family transcriptional regulator n=1 Tax=Silvimonas iriomotensis TaxID=449662 RepID=A0ABQ2P8G1_9NEIS|nr:TetR/AcrR family transcriptional regulator [Silvimonas iriomotensis]GGP20739.1 TetR family transcriptional regulator [Silvimonas iriomotensis]
MEPKPGRKQQSHQRIVDVAARAIRRAGYNGVGVADIMKEAGLTHGGFYAHFPSRDALLVEATQAASRQSIANISAGLEQGRQQGLSPLAALIESYLSDQHLADTECGCPVAALGSEMPRQSDIVRDAARERVQALIGGVGKVLPQDRASQAAVLAGTLVGTLQLARTLGDNEAGKAILASARATLRAQYDDADVANAISSPASTPTH